MKEIRVMKRLQKDREKTCEREKRVTDKESDRWIEKREMRYSSTNQVSFAWFCSVCGFTCVSTSHEMMKSG